MYCPEKAEYRLAESAGPPEGPAKGGEGRNDLRMRPKFLLCLNLTHFLQILFRSRGKYKKYFKNRKHTLWNFSPFTDKIFVEFCFVKEENI